MDEIGLFHRVGGDHSFATKQLEGEKHTRKCLHFWIIASRNVLRILI